MRTQTFLKYFLNPKKGLEADQSNFEPFFASSKNTGAWKGRLKRFFVDPYTIELAKNGTNII